VRVAKTGPYYTGVDLKASRSLWMSFADDTIKKLTAKLKKMHVAVPEETILKKVIDHTLCTVTKNAAKSGACGIDAVMGMLLYHGIEVDHRVVSQCMTILIRFRLIFTNQKYTTGYCRRFAISPTVQRHLPFVRDVKLPLMAEQVFNDQATRYTTAEPGGPELRSQTVYYFPNQYIVGNHIADVALDPSEPGYQSMMKGLNAESGDETRFLT